MSIPFKVGNEIYRIAMAINCNEIVVRIADDGNSLEDLKCIAKTLKHQCASCSLVNPNSAPEPLSLSSPSWLLHYPFCFHATTRN
jgi:hypothetical protein